jgi:hypothetical protein
MLDQVILDAIAPKTKHIVFFVCVK